MKYDIGEKYSEKFLINKDILEKFSKLSQDFNPIHMDIEFAKDHGYSRQVAHGVIQLCYLSKIIGMNFPGRGALWMNQTVDWLRPVFLDDEINIVLTIQSYSAGANILTLMTEVFNQNEQKVMYGSAQVKMTVELSVGSQKSRDISLIETPENLLKIKSLSNKKVALVTGSSRGIGEEIVYKLASENYRVVVNYKNNKVKAQKIVNAILASGGTAISICADMSNVDEVNAMAKNVLEKWGRCDLVIHGASPSIRSIKADETSYENIRSYLDVYLKGAILLVKLFSPNMKTIKFGRFIFIGTSYLFAAPPTGMAAYVSAKEALWGYTKALSNEIAHHGITVNMISPSLTMTDLTTDVPARIKEVEAFKNPTRRLVKTTDIANQVVHLCSEESGYINGVNLPITATPV